MPYIYLILLDDLRLLASSRIQHNFSQIAGFFSSRSWAARASRRGKGLIHHRLQLATENVLQYRMQLTHGAHVGTKKT